jgi:DNA topoisomerase-1
MELSELARAKPADLKKAGIGDAETGQILSGAQDIYHGQILREIGIPAVSLKKYLAAGIRTPEAFCNQPVKELSDLTGMSAETVHRHVEKVCAYLNKPAPKKVSRLQTAKAKKELLAIKGLSESALEKLICAGIIGGDTLIVADPVKMAAETGIPEAKIRDYQAKLKKKKETAIIQI